MIDEQLKYDSLIISFAEHQNLTESERYSLLTLHNTVERPDEDSLFEIIKWIRIEKSENYFFDVLTRSERLTIRDILEKRRNSPEKLNRHEYNYLCFVYWKYSINSPIAYPEFPDIKRVTQNSFEQEFVNTNERKKIYSMVIQAALSFVEQIKSNQLEIVIGGSFLNKGVDAPNDIDFILLIPSSCFEHFPVISIMQKLLDQYPKGSSQSDKSYLDGEVLPIQYDKNKYLVYKLFTLLGNIPDDRKQDGIDSLSFKKRNLVQLTIKANDNSN
ncbi:hypothetical protein BFP72_07420 [Reichenbachiella sp. 5M10]|uniref:DUF6932 family protein n=1 Tax=Reichenbachiella sp. 5M10 TaxID=1889772 RepID=UPI000C148F81|nr:hypothetical protein [Reichenbachiella sp. 5M10]PIB35236.1 hypothetical protein BFP72_07420 [Reichenbachiella sp. 5M10]